MSEKLFDGVGAAFDFEKKLIARGVTPDLFKAGNSNITVLDVVAQAYRSLTPKDESWIDSMIESENAMHMAFFGQTFDLSKMREVLAQYGLSKITFWKQVRLEVHFLPAIEFDTPRTYPGWQVMPESWYWQQLRAGNILVREGERLVKVGHAVLGGIVALIDTRKKPEYNDGKQKFAWDGFMGAVIAELRKDGKLAPYEYGSQSSRFGISPNEWEEHLKSTWAKEIGLEPTQVRLEMAIEANIIPQLYTKMPRKEEGTNSTWAWYEEFFKSASGRLFGGYSDHGGLAHVYYDGSDNHWSYGAVRPLGVLARA